MALFGLQKNCAEISFHIPRTVSLISNTALGFSRCCARCGFGQVRGLQSPLQPRQSGFAARKMPCALSAAPSAPSPGQALSIGCKACVFRLSITWESNVKRSELSGERTERTVQSVADTVGKRLPGTRDQVRGGS